jgi:hypothetical protein
MNQNNTLIDLNLSGNRWRCIKYFPMAVVLFTFLFDFCYARENKNGSLVQEEKNKDDLIFSTEKSSDYLTVLKNNTIEQLDKIFEVDHNLKFDDESSRKNLESKLLEKAKAWNLNLKNDLQLQKKDEIIYHWPFFSDRNQENTKLLEQKINESLVGLYSDLFGCPEVARWKLEELRKHKMYTFDIVYHVLNPRVISILNNKNLNIYDLSNFRRKDRLITNLLLESQIKKEVLSEKIKKISIEDIIGSYPTLDKLYYNSYVLSHHIGLFKENIPKDCQELWTNIYIEAISDGIKKYKDKFDNSCKDIFSKKRELPELTEDEIEQSVINGWNHTSFNRFSGQGMFNSPVNNKLLYYSFFTLSPKSEEVNDIVDICRNKFPQFVHASCLEKLDKNIKNRRVNILKYLLYNSNLGNVKFEDILKEEEGPENIFKNLEPDGEWEDLSVKPKSRVFKDISFGMTLDEVLNTAAIKSKSIRIQKNYDKNILEKVHGYSDLYALTELFGDESIIKMRFGWVLNKENNDSFSFKKQLVSIEFIPATAQQLREANTKLMENAFEDAEEIEGSAKMAKNLRDIGATKTADYYRKQSNEKFDSMISNYQAARSSQKAHTATMLKWVKGLESGEKPYRFVKGIDLTSDFEDLIGMRKNKSYYTNNPSIKIENNKLNISSVINQNTFDINIAEVSNGGLCFYPARKMDQTRRISFIMNLLANWHAHEVKRYEENSNINKNKNDF